MTKGTPKLYNLDGILAPNLIAAALPEPDESDNGASHFIQAQQAIQALPFFQNPLVLKSIPLHNILLNRSNSVTKKALNHLQNATAKPVIRFSADDKPFEDAEKAIQSNRSLVRLLALKDPNLGFELIKRMSAPTGLLIQTLTAMGFENHFYTAFQRTATKHSPDQLNEWAKELSTWPKYQQTFSQVMVNDVVHFTKPKLETTSSQEIIELENEVIPLFAPLTGLSAAVRLSDFEITRDQRIRELLDGQTLINYFRTAFQNPTGTVPDTATETFINPAAELIDQNISPDRFANAMLTDPTAYVRWSTATRAIILIQQFQTVFAADARRALMVVWLQIHAIKKQKKPFPNSIRDLTCVPILATTKSPPILTRHRITAPGVNITNDFTLPI